MKELLRDLVTAASPSGREEAVAKVIERYAEPWGETYTDPLGNLIVHRPGTGKRIMVAAHMDSIGLAATYIEEGGFVRFGALGGLNLTALLHQWVEFETGAMGVVCADGKADRKALRLTDLYVDAAGAAVRPGDTAVFCGEPVFMGDMVLSKYLDNRMGCAIALKALEQCKTGRNDLYFVFTAQEEVGIRGARTAAYTVDPELAVAVDVCGTGDTPDPAEKSAVRLGGGPVIKYMDQSVICHKAAVDLMIGAAETLGIPYQPYVTARGGTDAGAMHQARSGVPTGVLSIATRYIHTPGELCSMTDAEQCTALLVALLCG